MDDWDFVVAQSLKGRRRQEIGEVGDVTRPLTTTPRTKKEYDYIISWRNRWKIQLKLTRGRHFGKYVDSLNT